MDTFDLGKLSTEKVIIIDNNNIFLSTINEMFERGEISKEHYQKNMRTLYDTKIITLEQYGVALRRSSGEGI